MTSGMVLPPELSGLLNTLGFNWPLSDEGKIFDLAGQWTSFGDKLGSAATEADGHTQQVLGRNLSAAVERFGAYWAGGDAPKQNLDDGAVASSLIGMGLYVSGGVVIALKVAAVVQLVMLAVEIAQAIATAVVTFGASLAEIPIFRQITKFLLDQALDLAINAVLNG